MTLQRELLHVEKLKPDLLLKTEMALEANSLAEHVRFQWVDGEAWSKGLSFLLSISSFLSLGGALQLPTSSNLHWCFRVLASFATDTDAPLNIVG